eukprot:350406-Chlamydomonas_euryale.AAC.2
MPLPLKSTAAPVWPPSVAESADAVAGGAPCASTSTSSSLKRSCRPAGIAPAWNAVPVAAGRARLPRAPAPLTPSAPASDAGCVSGSLARPKLAGWRPPFSDNRPPSGRPLPARSKLGQSPLVVFWKASSC